MPEIATFLIVIDRLINNGSKIDWMVTSKMPETISKLKNKYAWDAKDLTSKVSQSTKMRLVRFVHTFINSNSLSYLIIYSYLSILYLF